MAMRLGLSTWPLEKRNRPSKWVTLDALRLLTPAPQKNR
jgi:hypothetical protein